MSQMQPYQCPSSPMSSEHQQSFDEGASPQSDSRTATARRRRKRIAIELPADQANALDKDEVKKWKNRIAAARARERTHQEVKDLQAMVDRLWAENQQQKAVIEHLQGVIQSLQPAGFHDHTEIAQQLQLMSTDLLPFLPSQAFNYHHYQPASGNANVMTNAILAELQGTNWLDQDSNQSLH